MKKYTLTVPENLSEMSVSNYLRHALPALPEWALRDAFQKRDVKMNGVRVAREENIYPDSEIQVFTPYEIKIPIVLENERILIINKPSGIGTDEDEYGSYTVKSWADEYAGGKFLPRLCHRLDVKTSGLLVFAKDDEAENALLQMFKDRTGEKIYQCLVCGTPGINHQDAKAYLLKNSKRSKVKIFDAPFQDAKPIETEWRIMEKGRISRLEVNLHTGKTHQIRAHLAHLGYPILGDDLYGNREANKKYGNGRMCLCATKLTINTNGILEELDGISVEIKPEF